MGESKHNPKYNKNAYKYHREKLEAFGFNLPKGEKQIWKDYAASKGTTVTTMIKEYMRGCIEADGFTVPEVEEAPEKVEEK